jgi:long-chain acyl-CoA synthetase
MLDYAAISIHADARQKVLRLTENDVFMWVNPLDRVGGIRLFTPVFFAGGTAIYYNGVVFIKEFFQTIEKYGVTSIHLQSFALAILLENDAKAFKTYENQLKTFNISGGLIPEKNKVLLQTLLPKTRLFIMYGATEVSPIACFEYSLYPPKSNCVGKPFQCTSVKLIDDDEKTMTTTSKDNPGIIVCESKTTMRGYWNAPELTERFLKDRTIITTDIGYYDSDGFLYLMGRRDDVIVSGGYKIAPYEIENVTMQMSGVLECVCIPSKDKLLGSVPSLFVVMEKDVEFSAKKILDFLSDRLETYKLPRSIRQLESFPRLGETQKINREAIKNYD